MIRPKPWWLRCVTPGYSWVTITPDIYHPEDVDPDGFPAIVAHENVHLTRQQAAGKWTWLWRYAASRTFRLREEALGIAAEIRATASPIHQRNLLESYSDALAGRAYWWAAGSPAEARVAILDAVDRA
jgi:hypothetical protein